MDDLDKLLDNARERLSDDDYAKLEALVSSFLYLTEQIEDKKTKLRDLRALVGGKKLHRKTAGKYWMPPANPMPGQAYPSSRTGLILFTVIIQNFF